MLYDRTLKEVNNLYDQLRISPKFYNLNDYPLEPIKG